MAGHTSRPGQSVASRMLAILDTFDISHTNQSLSDIARRAGLPLATTYRLVGELAAWRGLSRRGDGRYRIAGQCSGVQAGGEGPRWEGRQARVVP